MAQDDDHRDVRARAVARLDALIVAAGPRFIPDPAGRRASLAAMSVEQWELLALAVNAAARDRDLAGHAFDGDDNTLLGLGELPVPARDRRDLLRQAFDRMQQVLRDPAFDDQGALDAASAVVGTSVPELHAFQNGNGRTSRVLFAGVRYGLGADETVRRADIGLIVVAKNAGVGLTSPQRRAIRDVAHPDRVAVSIAWHDGFLGDDSGTDLAATWLRELDLGFDESDAQRLARALDDRPFESVTHAVRTHGLVVDAEPVDPERVIRQLGPAAPDALEAGWRAARRAEFAMMLDALTERGSVPLRPRDRQPGCTTVRELFETQQHGSCALECARGHASVEAARATWSRPLRTRVRRRPDLGR